MNLDGATRRAMGALLAMQRNPWEQGLAMQAFWEAGEQEIALQLAAEASYRTLPDGRVAMLVEDVPSTDPCAAGEVLHWACRELPSLWWDRALTGLTDWALRGAPRSPEGILYHMTDLREFWVDSIYMLPPFLAAIGHHEESLRQLDGLWNALYLPEKRLLAHRRDVLGAFVRKDAWGVGNGWALCGLARVIDLLPEQQNAEKQRLAARARALLERILSFERPDHGFFDVLDDAETFIEFNLSQMVAYAIYRGIRSGWLDGALLPRAEALRAAVRTHMDEFGRITPACGAPSFDRPGVAAEAQAFFLMMEAAHERDRT